MMDYVASGRREGTSNHYCGGYKFNTIKIAKK
jgi:hypothetical protein